MDEKIIEVVSVLDEAIDTESMPVEDMLEYCRTRDVKRLKFHPGKKPQRYFTREVKQRVWESYVMAADTDAERYRRAFLCGVVKVKNMLQRDGGQIVDEWVPAGIPDAAAMREEDAERCSASDRAEIGLVIFERSFLAPRTVRSYRLPPMLPALLRLREFRHADVTPPSQAQSSGAASAELGSHQAEPLAATTSAQSTQGEGSSSHTDATAPAEKRAAV